MNIKSLLIGMLIGIALTVIVGLAFGDKLTAEMADTTKDLGRGVQKAGEAIEQQGKELK